MRVSKGSGPGKTVFTWDEQNLLLETDNSNNLQARYTDYPAYWGGLASQRRGGTSSFYGFDSQGSTRILVASKGAITDSYSYTAFGEILNAGSGTVNPMLYVGLFGYYADDTNLYYVRARWLKTVIARWMNKDPIGLGGGEWNLFKYVGNNPVKFVDASGLTWNLPPDFDPDFGGGGTPPAKPTVTCIYRCAGSCGWLSCYAGPGANTKGTNGKWTQLATNSGFVKVLGCVACNITNNNDGNRLQNQGNAPIPSGNFRIDAPIACNDVRFGACKFPIAVPTRPLIRIHSREGNGGWNINPTNGCIRTSPNCLGALDDLYQHNSKAKWRLYVPGPDNDAHGTPYECYSDPNNFPRDGY